MVLRRRTATMCALLVLGLAACGSFRVSSSREDGGATPSSPPGGAATHTASPIPGDGATPTLPERIRFAGGATSATLEGVAAEGAHRRYVLAARRGQTMRIHVMSPSDAVNYGLTAPDGQPIKRVAAEARQGRFELPATGDYVVTIASAVDGAAYTLRVEIV